MIQMLNGIEGINAEGKNVKFEMHSLQVNSGEQFIQSEFNTESTTQQIVGVAITSDDNDALDASTIELRIGSSPIFPRNFECKMLRAGMEVAPNHRFFIFNKAENVDRAQVQIRYTDGGEFVEPYRVNLYLMGFER